MQLKEETAPWCWCICYSLWISDTMIGRGQDVCIQYPPTHSVPNHTLCREWANRSGKWVDPLFGLSQWVGQLDEMVQVYADVLLIRISSIYLTLKVMKNYLVAMNWQGRKLPWNSWWIGNCLFACFYLMVNMQADIQLLQISSAALHSLPLLTNYSLLICPSSNCRSK